MFTTLTQAMLILNYVMNHPTSYKDVSISVMINGIGFHETKSLDYLYGNNFSQHAKDYMKEHLEAMGRNNKRIHVFHSENTNTLCFYTDYKN